MKSRKKRKNSHYSIMKAFASSGNMRRKSSLESEESGKNPNGKISVRRMTSWQNVWRAGDYFIVTTNIDAEIFRSRLDASRITAPCGNETWRQCSRSCTKDIWEPGEIPDDICPHCGAPLCGNTIDADSYIEEGYLPQWMAYTRWLTGTVNPAAAGTGAGRRL